MNVSNVLKSNYAKHHQQHQTYFLKRYRQAHWRNLDLKKKWYNSLLLKIPDTQIAQKKEKIYPGMLDIQA